MNDCLKKNCDEVFDELIQSIITLCNIDSREGEHLEDAPFGIGPKNALLKALELAKSLGFDVENAGNRVGIASVGPDTKDYIALVGHLDVVDVLGTWTTPPFETDKRDGRLYARGVLDNKGPILSCLYAVKALMDSGYEFPMKVKVMFGTNEETGMNDMKWYFKDHPYPCMGWTPDCKYPVVYAERGRAKVIYEADSESAMIDFLNNEVLNRKDLEKAFDVVYKSEEFGLNQVRNLKIFKKESCYQLQVIDSYPADYDVEKMMEGFKRHENEHVKCYLESNLDAVYFKRDSLLVKTLERSYEEVMEEDGTSVTTTGGTYAKVVRNIVPFGPSFKGQKGIGHMPDEWMNIEDIRKNLYIYTTSLYNLCKEVEDGNYN